MSGRVSPEFKADPVGSVIAPEPPNLPRLDSVGPPLLPLRSTPKTTTTTSRRSSPQPGDFDLSA